MKRLLKKAPATGAVGYVGLFTMAMIMVMLTMYMASSAKLMTTQHELDDALSDAVLASLVADDKYYFETMESAGKPVLRFRSRQESYRNYKNCMDAALSGREGFYKDLTYTEFILYEVEGNAVTVTSYNASGGSLRSSGAFGQVKTPKGEPVRETSAYGRVDFALPPLIGGSDIKKSRDIYCTLEINDEHPKKEG